MFQKLLLVFTFILGFTSIACTQTTVERTIPHDGLNRSFRLHIPANYQEGDIFPLVFNFHGFNSNALEQELYSQMSSLADEEDFFVVYPQGVGLIPSWNVGWTFGSSADDVGFTSAMIDTLFAEYNIDTSRVYACGMSNGGFFSYQLACELNDRIAKIASVTGAMLASELQTCELENPIPVLQMHGTDDDVVNYNGTNGVNMPIEELLQGWRELNGCLEVSDTIAVPNETELDFSTAELIQYRDCEGNSYLVFYKIDNGGHTWPGAIIDIGGITNRDFNATREVWDFFNDEYPKDQIVDTETLELTQTKLFVYPNPATHFFYLDSNQDLMEDISIFNTLGQLTWQNNAINTSNLNIDAQQWVPGVYFAKVRIAGKTQTIRLVKK